MAVENYKFRIFDSVPKPESGIAYILYQGDGKQGNMLIITLENPVLSRQIKAGRFDKKMTISTEARECSITKQVLDQTGDYRYILQIEGYQAGVRAEVLEFRETPELHGETLGTVSREDTIIYQMEYVYDGERYWLKVTVESKNNLSGWISSKVIEKSIIDSLKLQ